ncbi:hypothetical protein AB4Y84_17050 [Stenotrophomonas sp. 2YAF22]
MSTVQDALQALTDLTPGRQQILADAVAGLSHAWQFSGVRLARDLS